MSKKALRTLQIEFPSGKIIPFIFKEVDYLKLTKAMQEESTDQYTAFVKVKEGIIHEKSVKWEARNPVEIELIKVIDAYEDLLAQKNNKRTYASRTWQMVKRHGLIGAAERAVNRKTDTEGYKILANMGLSDLTFEAVISKNPSYFSYEAVTKANKRLKECERDR